MTTAAEYDDSPLKSISFLVVGVFVFSIQDVIVKYLSAKYPVNELVFIRSCIAIVPILFIAHIEGGLHLLRTKHYFTHIIRCFFMFFAYISFYLSMAALPLAEAVSIFFSSPIFITIFSIAALGEKVEISGWIAVVVGFIGVIIMLRPGSNMFDPAALLALLTAVLYAVASIITRRLGKTDTGVSMAFYPTIMYVVFAMAFTSILNHGDVDPNSHPSIAFLLREWRFPAQEDLISLIAMGFIAATGFYCLSQAYRLAQPSLIAPFEYIAVPLGVVWGYLFFNDTIDSQSVIGMLFVVGSGLYIFGRKNGLTNKYVLSIFKIKSRK